MCTDLKAKIASGSSIYDITVTYYSIKASLINLLFPLALPDGAKTTACACFSFSSFVTLVHTLTSFFQLSHKDCPHPKLVEIFNDLPYSATNVTVPKKKKRALKLH